MRVLEINVGCGSGSTGRICTDIAALLEQREDECVVAYARGNVPAQAQKYAHRIGTAWDYRLHGVQTRLFDTHGFGSRRATREFLRWAEGWKPDIVHLHNIHGYYLQVEELFTFLKEKKLPVVWTLHDCWAFTGHCAHFVTADCQQWKAGCHACPLLREYPACYGHADVVRNYARKRAAFTGVEDLMLVTPSQWLADLTRDSFLKDYPVRLIPNGIDLEQFRPTPGNIRARLGIPEGKRLVLGVASTWTDHKGLSDFYRLAELLGDRTQVLLVGLTEKQKAALPAGMMGITRTESIRELAELYTAADVFVNPSRAETQGLTTIEALACGTPVITYDQTAVPEAVDKTCGLVVPCDPANICSAMDHLHCSHDACIKRAMHYDRTERFREYLDLYDELLSEHEGKTT